MKKVFFALLTIVLIGACNSPQKMTGPNADSTSTMQGDSTAARRDSL